MQAKFTLFKDVIINAVFWITRLGYSLYRIWMQHSHSVHDFSIANDSVLCLFCGKSLSVYHNVQTVGKLWVAMPTHPTNLLDDIWYCFSDNFEDFGAIQAEIW